MTKSEFERDPTQAVCKACGAREAKLSLENIHHPAGGLQCGACGRFMFWLGLDKNQNKRPALKPGTLERVWAKYKNHCADCGIHKDMLEFVGIGMTVQHVPPYKEVGHDADLIPFCTYCQADSARNMKRMETLIQRMMEKMDKKNGKPSEFCKEIPRVGLSSSTDRSTGEEADSAVEEIPVGDAERN